MHRNSLLAITIYCGLMMGTGCFENSNINTDGGTDSGGGDDANNINPDGGTDSGGGDDANNITPDSGTDSGGGDDANNIDPDGSDNGINDLVDQNQEFALDPEKALSKDSEEQVGEEWEEIETVITSEGEYEVTTTYRTMREHYSALAHPDEFVLYNANASVLWPGNIIQGSSILSGALNPIPITGASRTPLTIFISIVTGGGGNYSETIEEPAGSSVFEAMNNIVADHFGSTPGQATLEITRVYNLNHVMFNLNAGGGNFTTDISGTMNFNWDQEREWVMVRFAQQYYSLACDPPQNATALFTESVTVDDLAPFTSETNPVTYIDSVTYGRLFVYVYESLEASSNLEASLNIALNGLSDFTAEAQAAYQNVVNNSSVKVYALGGNAQDALAVATDFSSLRSYLLDGAVLSEDSPGAPISYNIRYLKNANLVRLNNTLEYTVDTAVPVGAPVQESTRSTFSLHTDQIQIVSQDDGFAGGNSEGQIDIRIRSNASGDIADHWDTTAVWLTCQYGNGEMAPGAICIIDSSTPEFAVPNVDGNKVIIEAYGNELDSVHENFSISKEFVYTCNGSICSWILDSIDPNDSVDSLRYYFPHNGAEFIEFDLLYDITINGSTL